MKNVVFQPWVGENYEKGINGKKVMILGESHYGESGKDNLGFTNWVVNHYLDYLKGKIKSSGWMGNWSKYTNVWKSVVGGKKSDFWHSIMFYNYVQEFIVDSRISPSNAQFETSETAFFQVLNKYQPDLVFVWGERLWDRMSTKGENGEKVVIGEKQFCTEYIYELRNGKKVKVYMTYHPSSSQFNKNQPEVLIKYVLSQTPQTPSE